jgi:hypothetical protein
MLDGARNLAIFSPLIAPIFGLWVEGTRKLFGLKSAPKRAGENLEKTLENF